MTISKFVPELEKTTYSNLHITLPDFMGENGHGLGLCFSDPKYWEFDHCVVDLSACASGTYDEVAAVTWGHSATFKYCVFTGGYKLFLLGSGDEDKRTIEQGKKVTFDHCVFMNFGRRGPEVQSGMEATFDRCLFVNWGHPSYFTVRNFGAWAHHGGLISANECVFYRDAALKASFMRRVTDHWCHFWQAVQYDGFFRALFDPMTYVAGSRRAFTASSGGTAHTTRCYIGGRNQKEIIVEGYTKDNRMTPANAAFVLDEIRKGVGDIPLPGWTFFD